MKRFFQLIISVAVCAIISSTSAEGADSLVVEYVFGSPELQTIAIGPDSYLRLTILGATNGGNPGEPALPSRAANILLPEGAEVVSVETRPGDQRLLAVGAPVEPVPYPVVLSDVANFDQLPRPDTVIYRSAAGFPAQRHEAVGTQTFRGHDILVLKLNPVEYYPAAHQLIAYGSITVIVHYTYRNLSHPHRRALAVDLMEVRQRVDNPDIVRPSRQSLLTAEAEYDLLVLTTPELADAFIPLRDHHNLSGIVTQIHTTDDVGSNDPGDIRDYVRQEYLQAGIRYVLIGADDDLIPARDLYVQAWFTGLQVLDLPSDLYFACLDGTYNFDGDILWGEPTDGEGGAEIDLLAEVYVGRASVENVTEASRFVSKTLQYLAADDPYLDRVLMVGQQIGLGGTGEYGGYSLDELIDSAHTFGVRTIGLPSDAFSIERLYDRDGYWSRADLVLRLNEGRHLVNHYGHSSTSYSHKISSSQILTELANDDLCFIYSQGCLAGHFDGMDCWAETMTIKTDHGAFAAIMNARQGWGSFGTTDGPSARYHREFWDAVFNPAEGHATLGRAHHDSKEDNLYRINEACMRWCYYETTLFGDPTITLHRVRSLAFDYSETVPRVVGPEEPVTLSVAVRGVGLGEPVAGTGRLHLSLNGGEYQVSDLVALAPHTYEIALPPLECGERLAFYVSVEEQSLGRVFESSPDAAHSVQPGQFEIVAFQDGFETDLGWTVSGGSWQRGSPAGLGGNDWTGPDPSLAYSGVNVYGYNLSGNYEPNLPERHLTSPVIDCGTLGNVHLRFQRWLGVETPSPSGDHASIYVSADGFGWTKVWENTSEIWDVGWNLIDLDLSLLADFQPSLFVRFTMGPSDGGLEYCGWNIDDLEVIGYLCDPDGDRDGDGVTNAADNCPDQYNPLQDDFDQDGLGNVCDACTDTDGDAFGNPGYSVNLCDDDNCPFVFNPDQLDINGDGVGNACCCSGRVGDANDSGDDVPTIGDVSNMIDALFVSSNMSLINCLAEADVNQSGGADPLEEDITIGDISYLIDYLFITGESLGLPDCL
jgi:hypothetical protein